MCDRFQIPFPSGCPVAGSPGAVGASLLRSIQNHQAHQAQLGGRGVNPLGMRKKIHLQVTLGVVYLLMMLYDVYYHMMPMISNDSAIAEIRWTLYKVATDHRLGQDHHNRPAV